MNLGHIPANETARMRNVHAGLGIRRERPIGGVGQIPRDAVDVDNAGSRGNEDWALVASNAGSKFRSVPLLDQRISAGEPVLYSSEDDAEALGRPDVLQACLYFSDVQGAPAQATLSFETSFDGVHYTVLGSTGALTITSGMISNYSSLGFLIPNALVRLGIQMTSGSAHVRLWLSGLPRGRRRFGALVLDRVLDGTTSFYSQSEFSEMLGAADKLCILALPEQVEGTGSITLTVQIEESPDGVIWTPKQSTPEINAFPLPFPMGISVVDTGSLPSSNFVRLRAALGGTSPIANLRLYVVGRGR